MINKIKRMRVLKTLCDYIDNLNMYQSFTHRKDYYDGNNWIYKVDAFEKIVMISIKCVEKANGLNIHQHNAIINIFQHKYPSYKINIVSF